ncbi:MAG: hypothetical protein E7368_01815 [Clostridiales bacterium]|nr:hypothetical protein [Clostridiales bacterium]
MLLTFQIIFTILAVICVACVFPVGTFLGWGWAGLFAFVAILFFVLMRLCKMQNELKNISQEKEPEKEADFLHPANKDDKKN